MIHYRNVKIPYIEPMSLDVVDNTFNTLQQGHIKALELRNQLETAIANLDMDQSEDAFKAELINGINDSINKSTIGGNMYYAMGEIINQQGNVAKNPAIIGRLKANQARKAFIEEVKKMDIDEDIKQMSIETSPYYYEDKKDKNGNIIGGTEWKPAYQPVKQVDFAKMIGNAIKMAAKEEGKSNTTVFMDANGNTYNSYVPGTEAYAWNDITTKYEKLSPEKISSAINFYLQNTPGAMASVQQDMRVGLWKASKIKGDDAEANEVRIVASNGVLDENGQQKSFSKYLSDRINPAIYAAQYDNRFVTNEYHNDAIKALNERKENYGINSVLSGSGGYNIYNDPLRNATSIASGIEIAKDTTASDALLYNTFLNQEIKKQLRNIGVDESALKGNMYENLENIRNLINSSNIDNERKNALYQDIYRKVMMNSANIKWINDNTKALDLEAQNAFIFSQALLSRNDPNIEAYNDGKNKYLKQYNDLISNLYGESDTIELMSKSTDKYLDRVIKYYGGEDKLIGDGFIIDVDKKGRKRIVVPKEIFPKIQDIIVAENNSKRNNISGLLNLQQLMVFRNDEPLYRQTVVGGGIGGNVIGMIKGEIGRHPTVELPLKIRELNDVAIKLNTIQNNANKKFNTETSVGSDIPVPASSYAAINPIHYSLEQQIQSPYIDSKTRTNLQGIAKNIEEDFARNISQIQFDRSNFSIIDNGVIRKMTPEERIDYQAAFDALKDNEKEAMARNAHIFESDWGAQIHPMINIPGKGQVILDEGFMNEQFDAWNRMALTKEKAEIKQSALTGKPVQFGWIDNTPIYLIPVDDENGKYMYHQVKIGENEPGKNLNAEEALTYLGFIRDLFDIRNNILQDNTYVNSDEVKAKIAYYLQMFEPIFGTQTEKYISNLIGF